MKHKILGWFSRNRQKIGYTIGGLNLLSSVSPLSQGEYLLAATFATIGLMIIFDTWSTK